MCGIVGYVGQRQATDVILAGLRKLEYRGYDSAGLAIVDQEKITVVKTKGRVDDLAARLKDQNLTGLVGIGHTRWATHGKPSDQNSHPHQSQNQQIAVVHNGIIENYQNLKQALIKDGVKFQSETDTEVVPQLIAKYYSGDLVKAVQKTVRKLEGSFALAVVAADQPEKIVAARKESPLIVGVGEQESLIASDVPAVLNYTNQVYFMEDGEIASVEANQIKFFDFNLKPLKKTLSTIDWSPEEASKGGYDCFTLKEIHEQPAALANTVGRRATYGGLDLDDFDKFDLEKLTQIEIVACGTSYHAGLVGKFLIEKYADLPVKVSLASEFRYQKKFVDKNSLIIAVSQSGETADTIGGVKEAKKLGAKILTISNVVGSSLTRLSDATIYTWAGPEIGVCSTKAYTTQLMVFSMLALDMAYQRHTINFNDYSAAIKKLTAISKKVNKLLTIEAVYDDIATKIKAKTSAFYIGRGVDYYLAMEGALKLKELSYVHTEAFAAGELKHGTIALIEPGTPVIVVATEAELYSKVKSNIQELKSRGAYVICITNSNQFTKDADVVIDLPKAGDFENGILAAIPMQLIAYHTATALGRDIDKPRNLAKSVTVE